MRVAFQYFSCEFRSLLRVSGIESTLSRCMPIFTLDSSRFKMNRRDLQLEGAASAVPERKARLETFFSRLPPKKLLTPHTNEAFRCNAGSK